MESAALAAREAKEVSTPVGVVAAGGRRVREVSVARAVTGHLRTTSAELVEPAVWAAAVVMAEWATVVEEPKVLPDCWDPPGVQPSRS